jgi:hypothetical protein
MVVQRSQYRYILQYYTLVFVDDILFLCEGSRRVIEKFRDIMD